jgi:hypothetical protein
MEGMDAQFVSHPAERLVKARSGAPPAPELRAQGIALGNSSTATGPKVWKLPVRRGCGPSALFVLPGRPSPLGWAIDFGAFGAGRFHTVSEFHREGELSRKYAKRAQRDDG